MLAEELALVEHLFQDANQALLASQRKQEALTATTSYAAIFSSERIQETL